MKNFFIGGVILLVLLFGASWWSKSLQSKNPDIVSRNGLHWHPQLEIYVKGERQEIPVNLGLGAVHQLIHTHDSTGVLHLEIQGLVKKDDTKLGVFFKIWGKDFMAFGSSVTMTVNGKTNTELENYEMKDGDKIVLSYE